MGYFIVLGSGLGENILNSIFYGSDGGVGDRYISKIYVFILF